ncbi:DMT family transporter [Inhella inkyongensis]|nr:DMT family transporter [Inhella inkyongensis]
MPASLLMLTATLLFAAMGLFVKLASAHYSAAQIVTVRGLIGVLALLALARWRGIPLRTSVPWMHAWRGIVGVTALCLWFWAIGGLPLATAITLNQMSSVWMALFLLGGAVLLGQQRLDPRLIAAVLVGFVGVALVLQPTFERDQLPWGLAGLGSGLLAALAYLQVAALGRAGEPEVRVVFYLSLTSVLAGALLSFWLPAVVAPPQSPWGPLWLLAVGLSATVAQVMMTAAYAKGRLLVNATLNYAGIVFAALLGWWVFDEALGWIAVSGIALIISAGLSATLLRSRQAPSLPTDTAHE